MHLLFLHGPPAVGKLTVGRRVAQHLGWSLFHNHLTVDMLLSVFPFGSDEFVRLREQIWVEVIAAAVRAQRSVVFTFNPERTVSPTFPSVLQECVRKGGGHLLSVQLTCPWAVNLARVEDAERRSYHKLSSRVQLEALREAGAFAYPPIATDLTLDTSSEGPDAIAEQLAGWVRTRVTGGANPGTLASPA